MYSDRHLFDTFLSFLMVQNYWLINYIPEPIKKNSGSCEQTKL